MLRWITLITCLLSACTDDTMTYNSGCGTINNRGKLLNPISETYGEEVKVVGIGSGSQITVQTNENKLYFIQLHGIKDISSKINQAKAKVESLGEDAFLFLANNDDCTIDLTSGLTALPGQLFTLDEKNFSEELLKANLVEVDNDDQCDSDLITVCYGGLPFVK